MIYLKRFIFGLSLLLWDLTVGIFLLVLFLVSILPSAFISYVITGEADDGPRYMYDLCTEIVEWPNNFNPDKQ